MKSKRDFYVEGSETLRRGQRDVSRARSARETNGGSGGPPPENFLKNQVNGANLDHPGYFFNKLLSIKLIPFYTVIDARKTKDLYSSKRKGVM